MRSSKQLNEIRWPRYVRIASAFDQVSSPKWSVQFWMCDLTPLHYVLNCQRWRHCRQATEAEVVIIRCHQSAAPVSLALVLCRPSASHRTPIPTPPEWAHLLLRVGMDRAEAAAEAVLFFEQPCCYVVYWWPPCPPCSPFPVQRLTSNLTPLSSSTSPPPFNSVSCFATVSTSIHSISYHFSFMLQLSIWNTIIIVLLNDRSSCTCTIALKTNG